MSTKISNEFGEYDIGDLVWAKMKGFPPWPGKVTHPRDDMKKAKAARKLSRCIFFFGSNNYAWIDVGCLKPYFQFKESLTYTGKTAHFKEAVKAIESYIQNQVNDPNIQNNGISDSDSRFDTLISTSTASTTNKKNSKARSPLPSAVKPVKKRPLLSVNSKEKVKKVRRNSTNNTDILTNVGLVNSHSTPFRKNNTILDRPEVTTPESTPVNVSQISATLRKKNIDPSPLTFGVIGLGRIGSGIAKNLVHSGHKLIVWNRTPEKVHQFTEHGAFNALTPSDVMSTADIVFSCVTEPQVVKDLVYGNCGVLSEVKLGKAYVEMTGIDPDTSQDIHDSITSKGGRYLEAMVQGSKLTAEEGNLVLMVAGDRTVFEDCQSAFCAIASNSFFLGEVGTATKMNMVLHSIKAIALAGLAEGMALADRGGLSQRDLLDILSLTSLKCELMEDKGKAMMDNHFQTNQALKLLQKDVCMTVQWSETMEQPCPINATVNEVFKHAKRLGYSDHDTSSVYVRAKF